MKTLLETVDDVLAARIRPSEALATLRDIAALPRILELIRRDPERLTLSASASYRHRNGFDKIVLASPMASRQKLVLHLWQPSAAAEAADLDHIHNHRWDFASVVLQGRLHLELYKKDIDGDIYTQFRYRKSPGTRHSRSLQDARRYQLEPCGTMPVSAQATAILTVGSTYTWSAELLHRAWAPPGATTATLIVQGPPIRKQTSVLVENGSLATRGALAPRLRSLRVGDIDQRLALLARQPWRRFGIQIPAGTEPMPVSAH